MENAKELTVLKTKVSKAVSAANELEIKTADDLTKATDISNGIRIAYKFIKDRMEAPIKRAYQAYKDIKAEQEKTFGSFVNDCEAAEGIIRKKLIDYREKELAKAAKKTDVIENKVEEGKMSFEKAAEKIEAITPQTSIEGKSGGALQFRKVKEVVVEDEKKIPREYFELNMVKVRKVALAGVEIPGVKVITKEVPAIVTNK